MKKERAERESLGALPLYQRTIPLLLCVYSHGHFGLKCLSLFLVFFLKKKNLKVLIEAVLMEEGYYCLRMFVKQSWILICWAKALVFYRYPLPVSQLYYSCLTLFAQPLFISFWFDLAMTLNVYLDEVRRHFMNPMSMEDG